jgi:hypothetical protein
MPVPLATTALEDLGTPHVYSFPVLCPPLVRLVEPTWWYVWAVHDGMGGPY